MAQQFLRGAYTPLITPFKNGVVDYEAYAGFIDWQIGQGVHGVVVAGTSGEASSLTVTERQNLLRVALSVAKRRAHVIAATGAASFADTLALTEHATQAGASAVLVLTPMFAKPTQAGMVRYYTELARHTDRPVLVYQITSRTNATLEFDALAEIVAACPNLVGMKQSDDDRDFVYAALQRFGRDFRIFLGLSEIAWDLIEEGAAGLIVAIANIAPHSIRLICDAATSGHTAEAMHIHETLAGVNSQAFVETSPGPIKYMAWRMGLIPRLEYRLPLIAPRDEVAARIDVALDAAGLLSHQG
jgi:4-hydroxy-tetrahydrodipicolinate synthase